MPTSDNTRLAEQLCGQHLGRRITFTTVATDTLHIAVAGKLASFGANEGEIVLSVGPDTEGKYHRFTVPSTAHVALEVMPDDDAG